MNVSVCPAQSRSDFVIQSITLERMGKTTAWGGGVAWISEGASERVPKRSLQSKRVRDFAALHVELF
jgi:hypothetical protein